MSTVYLVTGANRGIGLEIVKILAQRPDVIIYAGARNPSSATELNELAKGRNNIRVLKIDSSSVEDAKAIPGQIKEGKLDVVLANAGIALGMGSILDEPLDKFREHFEVNTLGPVILYQAVRSLISKGGVFAVTSSVAGQIGVDINFPVASYGASKAAVNFVVARIGYEDKDIVTLALHPGMVSTDMGAAAFTKLGIDINNSPNVITPQQSGEACVKLLDEAYKTKKSPEFKSYTGESLVW